MFLAGTRRRRRRVPSLSHGMGPARPAAATTGTPTVTGSAAARRPDRHVCSGPQQQSARGDVRRLQPVAFSAVGTWHSPGGSASTHHDPFALLRDERCCHHLYGQINTINAFGPAAARTRPTLLVQLGWTTIEALVDTSVSGTVINAKTFAQVADKDKVAAPKPFCHFVVITNISKIICLYLDICLEVDLEFLEVQCQFLPVVHLSVNLVAASVVVVLLGVSVFVYSLLRIFVMFLWLLIKQFLQKIQILILTVKL